MLMPNNTADADGAVVVAVTAADAVDTGAEYDADGWDKIGSCNSKCDSRKRADADVVSAWY